MAGAPVQFAIVAGEHSGDQLGADLMKAIMARNPDVQFFGIGGEKMQALGFESLYPMERLAVMGIVEVLGSLRELLAMRRELAGKIASRKPAVFIGIDAPDFNLGLEKKLKAGGIRTIHYVSPSVWAWRQGRVKKIRKAVDHVLTLLPFEKQFYDEHGVPASFVGHMLADEIPLEPDTAGARKSLCLSVDKTIVGVLPGSRRSEIENLGPVFFETIAIVARQLPDAMFVIPAVDRERYTQLHQMLASGFQELMDRVVILEGNAKNVMEASDVVLLTSGTATLETMLYKKPMVVAYKWGSVTHFIVSAMFKADFFSLPNLLAGEELVPEILQEEVKPEVLAEKLLALLGDSEGRETLVARFAQIHESIRKDASNCAAKVVLELMDQDLVEQDIE